MDTANFDDSPHEKGGPSPARVPATYYASTDPRPPLVPRGVTLGCGVAALVVLLLMIAGSAVVTSGGIGELFDIAMSMMQNEATRMYAADVTPAQRSGFESEMAALRKDLREDRLSIAKIEPVLQTLREATSDKALTGDEVSALTRDVHELRTRKAVKP